MKREAVTVRGLDGDVIDVRDEGGGRPVVIVHGGSSGPDDWQRVAQKLADRCRVLRYTRYTYRTEAVPDPSRSMDAEVHDVLALARSAGAPVVAVGHSSGGVVLLEAALAEPAAFAGLVLYEPPVAADEPLGGDALVAMRENIERGDVDAAVSTFLRHIIEVPRVLVWLLRLVRPAWRSLREQARAQLVDTEAIERLGVGLDRYRDIRVPVLLLGGALFSPGHLGRRLDALERVLPAVESRVTMRLQGHAAYVRAPGRLADIIAGFADRVGA